MDARAELMAVHRELSAQLDEMKARLTAETPGVPVYAFRDANGGFILAPVIAAKAQVLVALCSLDHLEGRS